MADWAPDCARSGTDPAPVMAAVAQGLLLLPAQSSTLLADKRTLALVSEGLATPSRATGSASWCYVAECGDEYASA